MFEKTNRSGLIIYLYYNRDAKKIQEYGDICYHSKKHRYLQLYVPTEELDDLVERLGKERYIKKIRRCHICLLGTTTCTTHWLVNHVLCIWKHETFAFCAT